MTYAKVKVEIGFSDSALTDPASVTWTDVSAYVRLSDGISYMWGRTDETNSVQPGSATFRLNNDDGDFTPGYTSGTYHPMPLLCPVRISGSIDGGSTYKPTWYGVVDEWESGWTGGVRGVTTVRCIDMVGLLQRRSMPSLLEAEMKAPASLVWYDAQDGAGTSSSAETYQLGAESGPEVDRLPAPRLAPTNVSSGGYSSGVWFTESPSPAVGDGSGFTTAFWYRADPFETDVTKFGLHEITESVDIYTKFKLRIEYSSGAIRATGEGDLSALNLSIALTHDEDDTDWHFVAYTESVSGSTVTQTLRLDDTETSSTRTDTETIQLTGTFALSGSAWGRSTTDTLHKGSIARFAYYEAALDSGTLDAIWQAGAQATPVYTTADLFERICEVAGGFQSLVTGTTYVVPTLPRTVGRSALDVLNELAQVERGDVFADSDGLVQFFARGVREGNTTAYATLDNDDVESGLTFTYNDRYLANRVIVYTASDDVVDVSDATSIAAYGEHLLSTQLSLVSTSDATDWAESVVTDRKDPRPRCPQLSVDVVAKSATVSTDLLEVWPADMVTVTGLPATGAPSSSVDLYVEGISGRITPSSWLVTLNTSPHAFTSWAPVKQAAAAVSTTPSAVSGGEVTTP